jgi:hypothetical protein
VVLLAALRKILRFMAQALKRHFKPCTLFAPSATRAQNCTFTPLFALFAFFVGIYILNLQKESVQKHL